MQCTLTESNAEIAVLSTRTERLADYREIQQGQPRTGRLYLPYSRPLGTQNSTTDFQPHTQGSAESQSGIKDAGRADRIGNAIDYLCRSAHVRNGFEAVGSEYCNHFRIAGALRLIHDTDLLGFV